MPPHTTMCILMLCVIAVYNIYIYIYILVQMLEQRMHGLAAGQEADRMLLAGVYRSMSTSMRCVYTSMRTHCSMYRVCIVV